MSDAKRLFARSSNGDQWYLITDASSRAPRVLHEPNCASGGTVNIVDVQSFLQRDPDAPQTKALVGLIEALVGDALEMPVGREAFLQQLRDVSEDAVDVALAGSKVALPLTTSYEALEFFNCMLDILTDQRAADVAAEAARIPAGFGST